MRLVMDEVSTRLSAGLRKEGQYKLAREERLMEVQ